MKDGRPTFNFKNNVNNENQNQIRAGGIIFYKYNKETCEPDFLMIKCKKKYEDFGGKTDAVDKCIEETVAREAQEESNNIFKKNEVLKKLKTHIGAYCKFSKYLVFICRTDIEYDPKKFGDYEQHDKLSRTVEWIPYSKLKNPEFIKKSLHIRLRFRYFFQRIDTINRSFKNP
jgi:hypothetical protein